MYLCQMISGAIETLSRAEKSGSSIHSITKALNGSANPLQRFTPTQTLTVIMKGVGSGKIIKVRHEMLHCLYSSVLGKREICNGRAPQN